MYSVAMLRTHTCGELKIDHKGSDVTLCGWVHRRRDHGGLIFLDLRDRYGFIQVVFDPKDSPKEAFATAEQVRPEWVLKITGSIRPRVKGAARVEVFRVSSHSIADMGFWTLSP